MESALLVNVDIDTLKRLMESKAAMAALMSIEGFRNLNQDIETIINKSETVKKARDKAALADPQKHVAASVVEFVCVAHRSYQRGRDQRCDAFDSGQPLTAFVLAKDALHLEVVLADTLVQESFPTDGVFQFR